MVEIVALRLLAACAWLLAALGASAAVRAALSGAGGPGSGPLGLAARGAACLALTYLGALAWRSTSPGRRAGRARRRVLRVLAVLSSAELQHDWLEAAPSLPLAESLAREWRHAHVPGTDAFEHAFTDAERETLRAFDADVRKRLSELPAGRDARDDVGRLDEPAWQALRTRAARARAALRP